MDYYLILQIQCVSKWQNLYLYLAFDRVDAKEHMLSLITNHFFENQALFRNLFHVP